MEANNSYQSSDLFHQSCEQLILVLHFLKEDLLSLNGIWESYEFTEEECEVKEVRQLLENIVDYQKDNGMQITTLCLKLFVLSSPEETSMIRFIWISIEFSFRIKHTCQAKIPPRGFSNGFQNRFNWFCKILLLARLFPRKMSFTNPDINRKKSWSHLPKGEVIE